MEKVEPLSPEALAEHDSLLNTAIALRNALAAVNRRMEALIPTAVDYEYRIALRPDEQGADPLDHRTLCDDIVVNEVECFRAEQMDRNYWWVACYLANHDRVCWSVRAKSNPLRIEWVTTEFPADVVYEHEVESRGPGYS